MTEQGSEWQTEALAAVYLEGVRRAIPGAELQFQVLRKIVERWCPRPRCILDLGCGDGILGRLLLEICPHAHGVFLDFSEPMLAATRNKLAGNSHTVVLKRDFSSPSWLEGLGKWIPFDVVVSGFAIHHQPDVRKRALYAEVYQNLAPGGVFLNLEHVASATRSGEKLFDDFFIDHLHQFHRRKNPKTTRKEIEATYYHRPDKQENILALVDTQCEWLRQIGFEDVDCFFRLFELALFGGRRSTETLNCAGPC